MPKLHRASTSAKAAAPTTASVRAERRTSKAPGEGQVAALGAGPNTQRGVGLGGRRGAGNPSEYAPRHHARAGDGEADVGPGGLVLAGDGLRAEALVAVARRVVAREKLVLGCCARPPRAKCQRRLRRRRRPAPPSRRPALGSRRRPRLRWRPVEALGPAARRRGWPPSGRCHASSVQAPPSPGAPRCRSLRGRRESHASLASPPGRGASSRQARRPVSHPLGEPSSPGRASPSPPVLHAAAPAAPQRRPLGAVWKQ